MKKIILHIGAGKCGSSAIQEFLSNKPVQLTNQGGRFVYGAITPQGKIKRGESLVQEARSSVWQYASSVNLSNCDCADFTDQLKRELAQIEFDILFLSCEGWCSEPDLAHRLLDAMEDYEVEVLFYVRPPLLWLNSAWWQWGAWTGAPFGRWLHNNISSVQWNKKIEPWIGNPGIDRVSIRDLGENIILDLAGTFGLNREHATNSAPSNKSLPNVILRFYQKHPRLRPSPHQSAIDFSLQRCLQLEGKPDWVIKPELIELVLNRTKESNLSLLKMMEPEYRKSIEQDPSWWELDYYSDRIARPPMRAGIPRDELENLLIESLVALHKIDSEVLKLNKSQVEKNSDS